MLVAEPWNGNFITSDDFGERRDVRASGTGARAHCTVHPLGARAQDIMSLESIGRDVLDFIRTNEGWAVPIVFFLAFGESLAFVSLLLPATFVLVGVGALIGASGIDFLPIWLAAAVGAALGDWFSYWIGQTFKTSVAGMWPLSRSPQLLPRGEAFVKRWGVPGVFIGRFFGPARAAVPLVAGIFGMSYWPFQLANFTSAFIWAAVVLAPGTIGLKYFIK